MAKERLNLWMRFALWTVGLIFMAGMSYNTISSQGKDIKENRGNIEAVKENVHNIQRGQDKMASNIESIREDIADQKKMSSEKRKEDREYQKEQRAINTKILTELAKWEAVKDGQN